MLTLFFDYHMLEFYVSYFHSSESLEVAFPLML